ncbi:hypothetical protein THIX_90622 [Thiomonas sp. X19]|uniref:CHASE domain-containing protein n=1 Tax=Thiomonas sp. X19 TaxID=1050370 RepID=UPI000B6CF90A|nr:CHASE domain-containing protein [Thiomonas sp. X19]SCC95847.1 hypothetical protein THIX_90622 [Thiomonas sp. X19]
MSPPFFLHLEPLNAADKRAIGYDMSSNPVRWTAMQSARDSRQAALSGMVGLVRDQPKNLNTTPPDPPTKPEQPGQPRTTARSGFLLSMPVFHHIQPRATPAERGAALRGWVYMPVRAQDLIDKPAQRAGTGHGFHAAHSRPRRPRWRDALQRSASPGDSAFQETLTLDFSGRRWALSFASLRAFERAQRNLTPQIVPASGLALTLLLAELRQTLGHERIKVSSEVQPVTLDLKTAIPCGLLTSEAVSNAFKHAFREDARG